MQESVDFDSMVVGLLKSVVMHLSSVTLILYLHLGMLSIGGVIYFLYRFKNAQEGGEGEIIYIYAYIYILAWLLLFLPDAL